MNKLKFISFFIVAVILLEMVYAGAATAGAAAASVAATHRRQINEANRMRLNCSQPVEFAEMKGCDLKYASDTTWDRFVCQNSEGVYTIKTDCGSGMEYLFKSWAQIKEEQKKNWYLVIAIVAIGVIVYAILKIADNRLMKKKSNINEESNKK